MRPRPRIILVAYDGSESAKRALDTAAELGGYGSRLTVVTVRSGGVHDGVIAAAREHLISRHVAAGYLELVGEVAETLIETASELSADLVVVGGRSRDGAQELVQGSLSSQMVRRAPCNVLVVR